MEIYQDEEQDADAVLGTPSISRRRHNKPKPFTPHNHQTKHKHSKHKTPGGGKQKASELGYNVPTTKALSAATETETSNSETTMHAFRQALRHPTTKERKQPQPADSSDKKKKETSFKKKSFASSTSLFLDKENAVNQVAGTSHTKTKHSVSSMRRSLKASMSPPPPASSVVSASEKKKMVTLRAPDEASNVAAAAPLLKPSLLAQPRQHSTKEQPVVRTSGSSLLLGGQRGGGMMRQPTTSSLLGPPQRMVVAPKTPNSLLRGELDLNDTDNEEATPFLSTDFKAAADDSLLVSPHWNQLLSKHHQPSSTGLVVVSPQAAAYIHSSCQKQQDTSSNQLFSPPQPRHLQLEDPAERSSSSVLMEDDGATDQEASMMRGDDPEKDVEPQDTSSLLASPAPMVLVEPNRLESNVEDEEEDAVVEQEQPNSTDIKTNRGACLDLSELFKSNSDRPASVPSPELEARLMQKTATPREDADAPSSPKARLPASKKKLTRPVPVVKQKVEEPAKVEQKTPREPKGGVQVDLSDLFPSDYAAASTTKLSPALQTRLMSKTATPRVETNDTSPTSTKKPSPSLLLGSSSSGKKLTTTSRLQKLMSSPPLRVPNPAAVAATGLKSSSSKKKNNLMTAPEKPTPKEVEPVPNQRTEPSKRTNGVVMDMTSMFASPNPADTTTMSSKAQDKYLEEKESKPRKKNGVVMDMTSLFSPQAGETSKEAVTQNVQTKVSTQPPSISTSKLPTITNTSKYDLPAGLNTGSKPKPLQTRNAIPSKKPLRTSSSPFMKSTIFEKENAISFDIPMDAKATARALKKPMSKLPPAKKAPSSLTDAIEKPLETWVDKQCDTFVQWLNYTLNPSHGEELEGAALQGSEASGLRALVLHQEMAKARLQAMEIFDTPDMHKVRSVIKSEIYKGRLSIRQDRDLYADLTLRKQITSLLMSYNLPWLHLGLEVMFGESITLTNQPPPKVPPGKTPPPITMRSILRSFIVNRVLSDSTVLGKYTKGKCKIPSGKFEKLYREEMRVLVLYRLMVLFVFMDRIKTAEVLDKVPRLFAKGATVKSSKAVLQMFCRDFLSSEGDFMKHLSRIDIKVSYEQKPVDEIEMEVNNLAIDLRDGVRLTRMTEILTDAPIKSLMSKLRLPAVSRLQKLHNVGCAVEKLKSVGIAIPRDVHAHHIVDGHREMVIKLLWSVIASRCIKNLLQPEEVKEEIENVLRSNKSRRKIDGLFSVSPKMNAPQPTNSSIVDGGEDSLKSLVFEWCKAVCSCFGLELQDFTDSFADGKALCYLVHYYHPSLIRPDEILPTTNDNDSSISKEKLRVNERKNNALARERVSELGGMPKMLPVTDSTNPPDERSMVLCLSYLCSRLMGSSKEIFATIIIQASYRRYREKVLAEKKQEAASFILKMWRLNKNDYYRNQALFYKEAVETIEKFVLCHKHALSCMRKRRLEEQSMRIAATEIQRHVRGMLAQATKENILKRRKAAVQIQACTRMYIQRGLYFRKLVEHDAALSIQKIWRGFVCQIDLEIALDSVVQIQRTIRGLLVRKQVQQMQMAASIIQETWWKYIEQLSLDGCALLIQTCWRGYHARSDFMESLAQNSAALHIQRMWRGFTQRNAFLSMVHNAIAIQSVVRGHQMRKRLSLMASRRAAIKIQTAWRGFAAQVQYQVDIFDIISVQSVARRLLAMKQKHARNEAIATLQCAFRTVLARSVFHEKLAKKHAEEVKLGAVLTLQCFARSVRSRRTLHLYRAENYASSLIQNSWRAFSARRLASTKMASIISIQSYYRTHLAKRYLSSCKGSVILLQSIFRAHLCASEYNGSKRNIVVIQSLVRRFLSIKDTKKRMSSIVAIQSLFRKTAARKKLLRLRVAFYEHEVLVGATVFVQALARKKIAQAGFKKSISSAILVQSHWRKAIARSRFSKSMKGFVYLQAVSRGMIARMKMKRKVEAAVLIQSQWRGFTFFVMYNLLRCDAIMVQSIIRRKLAISRAASRLSAVQKLQQAARRWRAVRVTKELRMMKHQKEKEMSASTQIQAMVRMIKCRGDFLQKRQQAVAIQRIFRGYFVKLHFQMDKVDIILSQSIVRRWISRRTFLVTRSAALCLQRFARRCLAQRQLCILRSQKATVDLENHSCMLIQSLWRGHVARREARYHAAARKIQKTWRCFNVHVDYIIQLLAVLSIQSHGRRLVEQRNFKNKLQAIRKLQSFVRGGLVRIKLRKMNKAAVVIQSTLRSFDARERYLDSQWAALTIQGVGRGYIARSDLELQHFAASEIQRIWRGYSCFADYFTAVFSAVKIQAAMRKCLAQNKADSLRLELWAEQRFFERKASIIQGAFFKFMYEKQRKEAAVVIQQAASSFLARRSMAKVFIGIRKLQAISRGRVVRKRRSKKAAILSKRIVKANRKAREDPSLRLGRRTTSALKVLETSTRLSEIMAAVTTLEAATRLSIKCCEDFVLANATSILLALIKTCNRSLPHVELLHMILLAFENVSMHRHLRPRFLDTVAAEIFLDLVQMFRDKDGILCLSIALLDAAIHCDEDVKVLCASKENLKRMKGVYALCSRKTIGTHHGSRSRDKHKSNRLKRRDTFDVQYGIRNLRGILSSLENLGQSPVPLAASGRPQHFRF